VSTQRGYHALVRLSAAGLAVLLVALPATAASATTPTLRLVKLQPLTVEGRSFSAGERVRVRVAAPAEAVRSARADRAGSFTVRFGDIAATRCDVIRVVAIRSSSGRVVLKRLPAPACSPG
jgi:hypothetical protein